MPGRNRKKPEKMRERAIQLYGVTGSIAQVARELGVAKSTVHGWIRSDDVSERVEQIRMENKALFAEEAGSIIRKGLRLLDRRLTTALEHETELEELLRAVREDGELRAPEKEALVRKIRALEVQKLGDITTAVGTLYDKRALAQGEATASGQFEVRIEVVDG